MICRVAGEYHMCKDGQIVSGSAQTNVNEIRKDACLQTWSVRQCWFRYYCVCLCVL